MADDLVNSLRMRGIFGAPGQQPLGMPDMNSNTFDPMAMFREMMTIKRQQHMEDQNRYEYERAREGYEANRDAGTIFSRPIDPIAQLGNSMNNSNMAVGPNAVPPMNHVFNSGGITDYQKQQLNLNRDKLESQERIALGKGGISQQNANTAARRAELAEKIADNKATDAEKYEWEMDKINRRGEITSGQIDQRGNIESGQIDQRGRIDSRQIGEQGNQTRTTLAQSGDQNLAAIGARIAGTADAAANKPLSPSQQKVNVQNAYQKILLTRPELIEFVTMDTDGTLTIKEGTNPVITKQINDILLGTPEDIRLDPQTKTYTNKPLKAGQVGDPLGIRK